ncbi:hypothetical protein [Constantimarinum furrinae]|uniref:ATP synthase protein I n=1 Tax=Constantimarinum furrinae TaxID=2562285 RepID=A0A7G8PSZ4_9FLAO|nr:hypothetical protein [Constantimarinum furrinae]QNJ97460.1 hypothetical protein ALE3EI_0885 [Constantimarinum furrinae]
MTKDLLKFSLKLSVFTALLCAIHYYIFLNFFAAYELYLPIWSIYVFNAVLVLIVFGIIYYKISQGNKNVMNIFLGLTLGKMFLVIIFLLPVFIGDIAHPKVEGIQFFIPYFLFLAFEITQLHNFLKKQ